MKTAKRRTTQIMQHDRSGTLVYTDKRVAQSLCDSRASCISMLYVGGDAYEARRLVPPQNFVPGGTLCSMLPQNFAKLL